MMYLHIGIPRTASSYLQHSFFPTIEGLDYLQDSNVKSALIKCVTDQHLTSQEESALCSMRDNPQSSLISAEGLSMDPWLQSYPAKVKNLHQWFPKAKIIVFLRDPVDWVMSLHGLAIQKHRFVPLKDFTGWDGTSFGNNEDVKDRKRTVRINKLSFVQALDEWVQTFSQEQVNVFFYENLVMRPVQELSRLCAVMDRTLPKNFNTEKRFNASFTAERNDAAAAVYSYLDRFTKPVHLSYLLGHRLAIYISHGIVPIPRILIRTQRKDIREALEIKFRAEKLGVLQEYPDCPWSTS